MTSSPLYIAFLWHMHQPFYKDPFSGVYRLPWVRLHGTKDYLDMAAILEGYPDIRQTFNLVPSLLEQITDYTDNNATDTFLEITRKRPSDLTEPEKGFMLEKFFLANTDNMIKPFPRYYELMSKRGLTISDGDIKKTVRRFSDSDLLDLQVLFNLTWTDPMLIERDKFLTYLVSKGRGYTEEDKTLLIETHISLMKAIIPKYRELSDKGQIEISASPFYHPILPLLWDTNAAKVPTPDIKLPGKRFSHPDDAKAQIRMATEYFEKVFGQRPAGMWPSEGSVSEDILKVISSEGLRWVATDEDILSASLGEPVRDHSGNARGDMLYSAYEFSGVSIIFRDRRLSDLIGFVYSGWKPKDAANDMIRRLAEIHNTPSHKRHRIVPIILDGENAWEHYKNDGHDFLRYLYDMLSQDKRFTTTTISGFLNEYRESERLGRLHSGSWINANFNIWIGQEEDNIAWEYLAEAREHLGNTQRSRPGEHLDAAWRSLYIAEGSDWNWWYGDDHTTETAIEFDELFRNNLMKVYSETGTEIPPHLQMPVLKEHRASRPGTEIRGFINPKIDGIMTSYFEWYHGAQFDASKSGGSMHKTEGLVAKIYYGFNRDSLFLRLDPVGSFSDFPEGAVLFINIIQPSHFRVHLPLKAIEKSEILRRDGSEWITVKKGIDVAVMDILECAIDFSDINASESDEINFFLSVMIEDRDIERCPLTGNISVSVPTPDFEAMIWY